MLNNLSKNLNNPVQTTVREKTIYVAPNGMVHYIEKGNKFVTRITNDKHWSAKD